MDWPSTIAINVLKFLDENLLINFEGLKFHYAAIKFLAVDKIIEEMDLLNQS